MRRVAAWLASFVVWIMVGAVVVGAAIAMLVPASSGFGHITDAQARAVPPLPPLPVRSTIYDDQGGVLQQIYFGQDRAPVPLKQVPQKVIDAVLATEDRDFYNHSGVDFRGIARAFLKNVGADSVQQGGSTITQQLVKNTLFPNGRPRDVKAKLHEAVLAERLEQSYTKDQILERYLNTIYFGEGAYGIETAAERYFNKDVSQLSLVEGAMLAGVISNPSAYDPLVNPSAARQRRHDVLNDMVASGYITSFEATRYDKAPLPHKGIQIDPRTGAGTLCPKNGTSPCGPPYHDATYAPNSYFVAAMQKWLLGSAPANGAKGAPTNVAQAALGSTYAARQKLLYQGGLKIYTTFDPTLQADADNAVGSAPLQSPLDAAIAVIDNATGAVRAVANRIPYNAVTHQVDVATGDGGSGGKQPGSGFKTFTLAAALQAGYSPNDFSKGGDCTFNTPQATQDNYDVTSDGPGGSLTTDIANSINCSFVNLELSMGWGHDGPKKVATMANTLGLDKSFDANHDFVTSLTLGTIGVTPLQMAAAYSTLANNGVRHRPVYVTRIVANDGTVLYNRPLGAPGQQVVSPQLAQTETQMLEGVITHGTATQANIGRPAAGKTGTTTGGTDLWFTGYTPQLTASVWVGLEATESSLYQGQYHLISERQAFGGSISAPIWKNFMTAALEGQPVVPFTAPNVFLIPKGECVSVTPPGRTPCLLQSPIPPPTNTTPTTTPGNGKGKGKGPGHTTPTSTSPTTAAGKPPKSGQ
ncbi:MAG TPA: transglycosylase domain-containing protein [Acidimicrobiia bacterium]